VSVSADFFYHPIQSSIIFQAINNIYCFEADVTGHRYLACQPAKRVVYRIIEIEIDVLTIIPVTVSGLVENCNFFNTVKQIIALAVNS